MNNKNKKIDLSATPYIPEGLYQQLPAFLKECCDQFQRQRERDVALTGSLGVIGGCLQNIQGRYRDGTLYPDLYAVIAAPAASGKSALTLVKQLGMPLHNSLSANPISTPTQNVAGTETIEESGQQKIDRLLFIPADTSAAMFMELLHRNGGRGIIFETEADTLVNTLKQEWGLIDDKLRKAYHHEPISIARKTDKVVIKMDRPRLSMVLSGTPGQIIRLIKSPENGLFSRIMFYIYRQEVKWVSASPCYNCTNPEELFLCKGEEILDMIKYYEPYPTSFILTSDQWADLDTCFDLLMQKYPAIHGDDAAGVIARMGVIVFRIAMILSALRRWESKSTGSTLQCSDQDFKIALELGGIYVQHSMVMMQLLPSGNNQDEDEDKEQFYKDLPVSFSRAQAVTIGKKMDVSIRSIGRHLRDFLDEERLSQPKWGWYKKP